MKSICRLSINPLLNSSNNMRAALQTALEKAGVKLSEIEYKDEKRHSHFGNWVYTPVLDNDATKKVALAFKDKLIFRQDYQGNLIDFQDNILESQDIENFEIGQRVNIRFLSNFCFKVDQTGTITGKSANEITVRKLRSKTEWKFRVGDAVTITKK